MFCIFGGRDRDIGFKAAASRVRVRVIDAALGPGPGYRDQERKTNEKDVLKRPKHNGILSEIYWNMQNTLDIDIILSNLKDKTNNE